VKLRKPAKPTPFETALASVDLTPSDGAPTGTGAPDDGASHREAVEVLRQMMSAVDHQLSGERPSAANGHDADGAGTDRVRTGAPTAVVPGRHGGRPLGEILEAHGLLTREQIDQALVDLVASGKRLGTFLVDAGLLDERALVAALAEQFGTRVADLRRESPSPDAITALSEKDARAHTAIPFRRTERQIAVVVADPTEPGLVSTLSRATGGLGVALLLAPVSDIRRAIETSYKATAKVDEAVRAFETLAVDRVVEETPKAIVDENAPIVQVVNLILEQAVRDRASDVHIEPLGDRLRIRNRTDGALHEVLSLPESMAQSLVSRIKVMANMNIVERRRPQDGQIETAVGGRALDIRVSTTSTVFGEKCVMRLLDKSRALYHLSDLGMPADTAARFEKLVHTPYGMVVCAGPTGSGKTTTLYATLTEISREEINVMTIEDPVEYVFPEINQIQINEQAEITFANGLRSILRQDPDAVMVGEIRDVETARIAVQAALTGHFVMSSVHATDATSALHRFLDMGIEPFLIASCLTGVVAQRLVRRICPTCKVPHEPDPEELAYYHQAGGPQGGEFFRGEGCNFCAGTGFFERIGIYEVMPIGDELKQLVIDNAPQDTIRRAAIGSGMRTLADEALRLVSRGETTIGEVLRTVYVH
jgi:type IV pilus assembly protein PilB